MPGAIRVVHVDDDPEFADLTAEFLQRENERLAVQTAGDPGEARAALAGGAVDCIVSDYDMPRQNGIDFLESVRADHPDLPFILFTGRGSEAVASEAISAGATDYLRKEAGTSQYAVLANRIESAVEQYRARQRSEREAERLSQLVSIVSHDLRNPLNVASSRLGLAREDCDSDHLDYVDDAHDRIGSIVDDTLTLARLGGGVERTDVVDLPTVSRQCWDDVGTGDAALEVAADRLLRADADRLRPILANLFENAVEHGGEGVTVTVGAIDGDHTDGDETGGDGPGFYVADDGSGLPEGRDDLFEPGVSTRTDGTGLGLTIVRDLVEAHGWAVAATESEAGGTRVEITGIEVVE